MLYSDGRFINAAHHFGIPDSEPLPDSDLSAAVQRAVTDLMTLRSPPGGTVYLRPGLWHLGGDLPVIIPPEIELVLAPGAVIVPLAPEGSFDGVDPVPRPSVEIHGPLDVGPGMFVETAASAAWRLGAKNPAAKLPPVGWVCFATRVIDMVSPDWWGAGLAEDGPWRARVDTEALEAAARAAVLREPWSVLDASPEAPRESPPLAIEVRAPLRLDRQVTLGQRVWTLHLPRSGPEVLVSSMRGLVLRGLRGAAASIRGARNLSSADVVPSLEMVSINTPHGVRVEGLHFDIGTGFYSALTIHLNRTGERPEAAVVDCVFTGTRGALVAIGTHYDFKKPPTQPTPSVIFAGGGGAWGEPSVTFDGCTWIPHLTDYVTPVVALEVTALDRAVAVRDANFVGEAARMIRLRGGRLSVSTTRFANAAYPVVWFASAERPPVVDAGLDVEIPAEAYLPLALRLRSCTSSSLQFLASTPSAVRSGVSGERFTADPVLPFASAALCAELIAVHHEYDPGQRTLPAKESATTSFPPAIHWGSYYEARFQLILIACRVAAAHSALTLPRSYAGMVTVDKPAPFPIYDAWLLPPGHRYAAFATDDPCSVYSIARRSLSGP